MENNLNDKSGDKESLTIYLSHEVIEYFRVSAGIRTDEGECDLGSRIIQPNKQETRNKRYGTV